MSIGIKICSVVNHPLYKTFTKLINNRMSFNPDSNYKPFYQRCVECLEVYGIILQKPIDRTWMQLPPWSGISPHFDHSLAQLRKSSTNPVTYISQFRFICAENKDFRFIYTDGSKFDEIVGYAVYEKYENISVIKRIPSTASSYTAELLAILDGVKLASNAEFHYQFAILTDSLSSIQALQNPYSDDPIVQQILNTVKQNPSKVINFIWIPSHVGIEGNECADQLARSSANHAISPTLPTMYDLISVVKKVVMNRWNETWNNLTENKLFKNNDTVLEWKGIYSFNRRESTILTRLRTY